MATVMGVLIISFGIWGIADVFKGTTDTSVATVGGQAIAADSFQREYRNTIRNLSTQTGQEITPDQARAHGLAAKTLDQMINRASLDQYVAQLGLTSSDTAVSAQIRSMQAFAGPLGTFDHNTFLQRVNEAGYNEQEFIEAVRGDNARDQLISATQNGLEIPAGYAKALFSYLNEVRAASYVILPSSAAGAIPAPDDATLTAYVKAHAGEFSTPEYRELTYAEIGPADVMSQLQATDAQVRQEYDTRRSEFQVPERRDLQQITFPSEADAKAARAKLDSGMTFDALAQSRGLSAKDMSLGTVAQSDIPDKPTGTAAFALPLNGTTQPIKGPFGWVLVHVTKITPGLSRSFDEVKAQLKQDVLNKLAASRVVDITNAYSDSLASGDTLEEAAKKAGMKIIHVAAVDKNGLAPDGTKANVPAGPDFMAQVFSSDVGQDGDVFATKDGVLATADWTAEQRAKALDAKAKALAAQAGSDHNLAAAAKAAGGAVQSSPALQRGVATDVFGRDVIAKLFSEPPGTAVYGPLPKGDGYVIARVTGVLHPDLQMDSPQYAQGRSQLSSEVADDVSSSLAMAAKAKAGVTVNQSMVDRTVGGGDSE
jgi:peptidyl-prolyl cis-trans isomerase D